MAKLRVALGDETARLLQTVHGFGYRLNAHPVLQTPKTEAPALKKGMALPNHPDWQLTRKLPRPGQWWLTRHSDQREWLVRFAEDAKELSELRREIHHQRAGLMAQENPFEAITDYNLDHPLPYLAWQASAQDDLQVWLSSHGGAAQQLPAMRQLLALALCRAVVQMHEAGVHGLNGLRPWQFVVRSDNSPERFQISMAHLAHAPPLPDHYTPPECPSGTLSATATGDVYALGVLIYKVLVGDLERSQSPGWHKELDNPLLSEDLALATQLEPSNRLPCARSLLQRLEQLGHRRHHQVALQDTQQKLAEARQHSLRLRSRQRFYWLAGGLMLAGVAILAAHLWVSHQQQARTQMALGEAEALNQFIDEDLLAAANPYGSSGGQVVTVAAVLDNAAAAAPQRLASRPLVLAKLLGSLGDTYRGLNLYLPALRQHIAAAEVLRKALGPLTPDRAYWLEQAGYSLIELDRLNSALALGQAMVRDAQHRNSANALAMTASGQHLQGWALTELGQPQAAEVALSTSVRLWGHPTLPKQVQAKLDAQWDLAEALTDLGRWQEAQATLQPVTRWASQLRNSATLGWVNVTRARLALESGKLAEAAATIADMQRIATTMPPGHRVGQQTMHLQARLALTQGQPAEALALLKILLPAVQNSLGPLHRSTLGALYLTVQAQVALGQPIAALATAQQYQQRTQSRSAADIEAQSATLALAQAQLLAKQANQQTLLAVNRAIAGAETLGHPHNPLLGELLATRAQLNAQHPPINFAAVAVDAQRAKQLLTAHYGTAALSQWGALVGALQAYAPLDNRRGLLPTAHKGSSRLLERENY